MMRRTRVDHVEGLGGALGIGRLPGTVHRVVERGCGQPQGEAGCAVLPFDNALSRLSPQDIEVKISSRGEQRARLTTPS